MSDQPNSTGNKLPSMMVCKRYGVTRRTLNRWMDDEKLGFPKPLTLNGRHYFDEIELNSFDKECAKRQAEARGRTSHLNQHAEVA